eukprot:1158371-Pelagomonas_calceolata.AAC.2
MMSQQACSSVKHGGSKLTGHQIMQTAAQHAEFTPRQQVGSKSAANHAGYIQQNIMAFRYAALSVPLAHKCWCTKARRGLNGVTLQNAMVFRPCCIISASSIAISTIGLSLASSSGVPAHTHTHTHTHTQAECARKGREGEGRKANQ